MCAGLTLAQFEMPSTLTGKKSVPFHVAAKSSTPILNGALKVNSPSVQSLCSCADDLCYLVWQQPGSGRWVFSWKNDVRCCRCTHSVLYS